MFKFTVILAVLNFLIDNQNRSLIWTHVWHATAFFLVQRVMKNFSNLKYALTQAREAAIWRAWSATRDRVDLPHFQKFSEELLTKVVGESWGRLDRLVTSALARNILDIESAIRSAMSAAEFEAAEANFRLALVEQLPANQRDRLQGALRDASNMVSDYCLVLAVAQLIGKRAKSRKFGARRSKEAATDSAFKEAEPALPRYLRKTIDASKASASTLAISLLRQLPAKPEDAIESDQNCGKWLGDAQFIRHRSVPWHNEVLEAYWLVHLLRQIGWIFPTFFQRLLPAISRDNELTIDQVRWLLRRSDTSVLDAAVFGARITNLSFRLAQNILLTAEERGWGDDRLARFRRWPWNAADHEEVPTRHASFRSPPAGNEGLAYCAMIALGQLGWPLPGILTRLLPLHWTKYRFEFSELADLTAGSGISTFHFQRAGVHVRGMSADKLDGFIGEFAPQYVIAPDAAFRLLLDDLDENDQTVIREMRPRMLEILEQKDRFRGTRLTLDEFLSVKNLVEEELIQVGSLPPVVSMKTAAASPSTASRQTEADVLPGAAPPRQANSFQVAPLKPEKLPEFGRTGVDFDLAAVAAEAHFSADGRFKRRSQ